MNKDFILILEEFEIKIHNKLNMNHYLEDALLHYLCVGNYLAILFARIAMGMYIICLI
jgi:hypothetical protein